MKAWWERWNLRKHKTLKKTITNIDSLDVGTVHSYYFKGLLLNEAGCCCCCRCLNAFSERKRITIEQISIKISIQRINVSGYDVRRRKDCRKINGDIKYEKPHLIMKHFPGISNNLWLLNKQPANSGETTIWVHSKQDKVFHCKSIFIVRYSRREKFLPDVIIAGKKDEKFWINFDFFRMDCVKIPGAPWNGTFWNSSWKLIKKFNFLLRKIFLFTSAFSFTDLNFHMNFLAFFPPHHSHNNKTVSNVPAKRKSGEIIFRKRETSLHDALASAQDDKCLWKRNPITFGL